MTLILGFIRMKWLLHTKKPCQLSITRILSIMVIKILPYPKMLDLNSTAEPQEQQHKLLPQEDGQVPQHRGQLDFIETDMIQVVNQV